MIVLLLCFDISVSDVIRTAFSFNSNASLVCLVLLFSVVIFPVLEIITFQKPTLPLSLEVSTKIPELLRVPYGGFCFFIDLYKSRAEFDDNSWIRRDIPIYIMRTIEMILWWSMSIYMVYSIIKDDNEILRAISETPFSKAFSSLILAIGVYFFILIIVRINTKLYARHLKKQREIFGGSNRGTRGQQYYYRNLTHIPSGCRACGGPYPECRSSCSLYDD